MATAEAEPRSAERRLQLYLLPARMGASVNASPFSTKLLAFVRMAGLEHEVVPTSFMGRNENPKKLWPYIRHGDTLLGDTAEICRYLAQQFPAAAGPLLPSDPARAAAAHAACRMLEEGLFGHLLWYRFGNPECARNMADSYFAPMPWPIRALAARSVTARYTQRLQLTGVASRTESEILAVVRRDLEAASAILGDQPFLFGAAPAYVDASLYGLLDTVLRDGAPVSGPRDAVAALPNLVAFEARVRARWFPELDAPPPAAAAAAAGQGGAEPGSEGAAAAPAAAARAGDGKL